MRQRHSFLTVLCGAFLVIGVSGVGWATAELVPPVDTFCNCLDVAFNNPQWEMLCRKCYNPEYEAFMAQFLPDRADLNGESWINVDTFQYDIPGNGMLDCATELKLVETVLKDTAFSLPNGLTYQVVKNAWDLNEQQFAADIGTYWGIFGALIDGLPQLLKGYMIIGDGSGTCIGQDQASWNGSAGFIQGILCMLSGIIANPTLDLDKYGRLPLYFAPNGDADGDGCTNAEEFAAYGGNPDLYVANALNPSIHPDDCRSNGPLGFSKVPTGGRFEAGAPLELTVTARGGIGLLTYQWFKDNNELPGQTDDTLAFTPLQTSDTGWYKCRVTDEAKTSTDSDPVYIAVFPTGSLPASGLVGTVAAAVACLLAGAFALRRHQPEGVA